VTPPLAIVWDFDGTLADTRRRNYNVVRRLIAETTGTKLDGNPALASPETYDEVARRYFNWRELYANEFGLDEDETDRIGHLWSAYQLRDDTPAEIFEGIGAVLAELQQFEHGIVSQNACGQIARTLAGARLAEHFRVIVGYDNVDIKRQKPARRTARLHRAATGLAPGCALYIGDHETDVRCARNAQRALPSGASPSRWSAWPACFAAAGPLLEPPSPTTPAWSPHEIPEIARRRGG
jgi:HAD superfamily hydrolase (TIGR01549 family)